MSQRQPSINFCRPMEGIGLEQLEALRDWAKIDAGLSGGVLKSFLWPALMPNARIIDSDELRHIDAHPDIDVKLDGDTLNHLEAHVMDSLPTTARDNLPTKLLPTSIHSYKFQQPGKQTRDVLKVATNEVVMIERFVAKLAVCDFFALDPEAVPEDIWLPDEHVVGVHFVRGDRLKQKKAVRLLDELLNNDPGRLPEFPETVTLQPVAAIPSIDRSPGEGRQVV